MVERIQIVLDYCILYLRIILITGLFSEVAFCSLGAAPSYF